MTGLEYLQEALKKAVESFEDEEKIMRMERPRTWKVCKVNQAMNKIRSRRKEFVK